MATAQAPFKIAAMELFEPRFGPSGVSEPAERVE